MEKKLKESFSLNGYTYTLIDRDLNVAVFGLTLKSGEVRHWEVCKIYHRKDKYGVREHVPSNEQFGKDLSRFFVDKDEAMEYFKELKKHYTGFQGVPEVVSEVEENAEVVPEHQYI